MTIKYNRKTRKQTLRYKMYKSLGGNKSSSKVNTNKTDNLKDIIISQEWAGLGDNLQYTTLPELYSKLGHNVYISSQNQCRNSEICDLVWKLNPYIKGISDLPANVGSMIEFKFITTSYIKNIERSHGIFNGYRKYPVIYYKPKRISKIDKFIFYDTTSHSSKPTDLQFETSFESIFSKHPDLIPRRIDFTKIENRIVKNFTHEPYTINNIFEYCDLLASCKVFICGFSGSAVLASAIKQDKKSPIIYSFKDSNTAVYIFDNVNYSKWL